MWIFRIRIRMRISNFTIGSNEFAKKISVSHLLGEWAFGSLMKYIGVNIS